MSNATILKPKPMTVLSGTNTLSGYAAANAANDYMGVVWKAQSAGSALQWIIVDMGADVAVDTVVLLGLTGALSTWTLRIDAATQAQGSGFGAGTFHQYASVPLLAGSAATSSARGRAYWEAPAGGPAAARYFRIVIDTLVNNTAITIARVVLGTRIRPTRNFDFGAVFGLRDTGLADFSRRGVLLRTRGMKLRSVGLSFNSLYRDEVESFIHPLIEKVGGTGPIALILDPDAHAQRQNRIWFGPLTGDLGTIWARANAGFQWQANIVDLESFAGDA
ncbi:MAG: hypothetical protein KA533_07445 [Sphingobium sp.]|nr:hypothetical protein [Sphingobium sp.]MBP6112589.1 hypothetical protein [Sphingobium sp.]MBP8671617.1 hypothetical protein [Sphingobium sp.]MBP9158619.1 hypothetical protein [Sphingobium sp.]